MEPAPPGSSWVRFVYDGARLLVDDDELVVTSKPEVYQDEAGGSEDEGGLKMYVWENVLSGYSSGMAVALAHSLDEAKTLLRAEHGRFLPFMYDEGDELDHKEPRVVTEPAAFTVTGGG